MRPDYQGIMFFSASDWSTGYELQKAIPILDSFDPQVEISDVNKAIELYNIFELLDCGIRLTIWTDSDYQKYLSLKKPIFVSCAKFFKKINNQNVHDIWHAVAHIYTEDFWNLFEQFSLYDSIDSIFFKSCLDNSDFLFGEILTHKKIIQKYGNEIADYFRSNIQSVELLITHFFENTSSTTYYLPSQLAPSEFDSLFVSYIKSGQYNPNYLKLLSTASSSQNCPISDYTKLLARREYANYCSNMSTDKFCFKTSTIISFSDISEPKIFERIEHGTLKISYDIKWIRDNLDYPTLFNNFIYLFEFFDGCFRSLFPAIQSRQRALELITGNRGKTEYPKNYAFDIENSVSLLQIIAYQDILSRFKISIETMSKWFFETYLPDEFNVHGFIFSIPSPGTTYVEKIKSLCPEMDSILKQFRLYQEYGDIDRELLEISSNPIAFSSLKSLVSDKYAYISPSSHIPYEQSLLFSDQSRLTSPSNKGFRYSSLYECLTNTSVNFSDYDSIQQQRLSYLQSTKSIIIESNGIIHLNDKRIFILKDLYDCEVTCLQYYKGDLKSYILSMINSGELVVESTLFSRPEQDYLKYILNRSKYSDGLDLRNKYMHGTYSIDAEMQQNDYYELLKILILYIGKINEEFCLRDSNQGG